MSTADDEERIQELNGRAVEPGIPDWFAPIMFAITLAGLVLAVAFPLVLEN